MASTLSPLLLTVRAWIASHSCGDWILWANSRVASGGLGERKRQSQNSRRARAPWGGLPHYPARAAALRGFRRAGVKAQLPLWIEDQAVDCGMAGWDQAGSAAGTFTRCELSPWPALLRTMTCHVLGSAQGQARKDDYRLQGPSLGAEHANVPGEMGRCSSLGTPGGTGHSAVGNQGGFTAEVVLSSTRS